MRLGVRHAPLDLIAQPEPARADRRGPGLTPCFLWTLMTRVSSDGCRQATLDASSWGDANSGSWGMGVNAARDGFLVRGTRGREGRVPDQPADSSEGRRVAR